MIDLGKTQDHVRAAIAAFKQARLDMTDAERLDTIEILTDLYNAERRLNKATPSNITI